MAIKIVVPDVKMRLPVVEEIFGNSLMQTKVFIFPKKGGDNDNADNDDDNNDEEKLAREGVNIPNMLYRKNIDWVCAKKANKIVFLIVTTISISFPSTY